MNLICSIDQYKATIQLILIWYNMVYQDKGYTEKNLLCIFYTLFKW